MSPTAVTVASFIGLIISVAVSATAANVLASKRIKDLEARIFLYIDVVLKSAGVTPPVPPVSLIINTPAAPTIVVPPTVTPVVVTPPAPPPSPTPQ